MDSATTLKTLCGARRTLLSREFFFPSTATEFGDPKWPSLEPPFPLQGWSPSVSFPQHTFQYVFKPIFSDIVPDVDAPSELDTHNVMQWGQFVDHDITHTPLFRLSGESAGIQCCEADGSGPYNKLYLHPECFPIEIPENDPFFMQHGQRCMHFVRSMPGPQLGCSFGYGEQMNQITATHDGSNVYGSDSEDEEALRAYKGGLLKIYTPDGETRTLLPQEEEESAKDECEISETLQELENQKCFKAGEIQKEG